ncbi:septum formation initiator family protein [Candidatus Dependentiae bacterium]|nr:septum formation initiator family protein [Candidatus Dependentiae bacterium]
MTQQHVITLLIGTNLLIAFGMIYKKSHAVGLRYQQQQLELTAQQLQQEIQRLEHTIDLLTNNNTIAQRASSELGMQSMQLQQVRKLPA